MSETSPIALIVDDEADLCRLMQITLTKMGVKSDVAYNLEMAITHYNSKDYDFCLTDLSLPDGSGLDMVKHIIKSGKNTPVAVITAHGNVDVAIESLKLGAFDFVNKPLDLPRLRQLVENALKVAQQKSEPIGDEPISREDKLLDERLIGDSEVMTHLRGTIKKLARSQAPVFLSGASGTGKEVVAKLIHELSPRHEGSFVPVNCGAIPSELMESEFFGHKKGSFTGAITDKIGLFQQANGGTLFLDEVADLPLAMQVKLLRAIQEKTVRAIGDTKEVPVDIRILSATHKDLAKLVQQGAFRQDLFYRINVIMVKLPTLNERRTDIPRLAEHFLQLISNNWQIELPTLTADALESLKAHNFEGNVRELRNVLEQAITMSETNEINSSHLFSQSLFHQNPAPLGTQDEVGRYQDNSTQPINLGTNGNGAIYQLKVGSNYDGGGTLSTMPDSNNGNASDEPKDKHGDKQGDKHSADDKPVLLLMDEDDEMDTGDAHLTDDQKYTLPDEGLEEYLQNQEIRLINAALHKASGNKTQAAKLLKMTFRSLRYRMKKLEIGGDDDIIDSKCTEDKEGSD